jgi:glucose-6-phosphate 1-dehydrogenase
MGNEPSPVNMVFDYVEGFKVKQHEAYEHVLFDCIKGDLTLFPRQDEVDATWAVLDPLIQCWEARPPSDLPNYEAGTWGPRGAVELMAKEGRAWRFSDEGGSGA